jgi:diacylglycerol O-acyltransferase / wax synthase
MIDGVSGVDLTTILLNAAPSSDIDQAPDWDPRTAPTPTQLAVAEAARLTRRIIDGLGHVSEMAREGRVITERTLDMAAAALSSLRSGWLSPSSRTPLNPDIGPNRRFDWTELPLGEVKSIKNRLGGSVNDVVLAVTAGAVRRFLIEHRDFDVSGTEFRAMNPVSTRKPSQRGALGNQVAMWLVDLAVDEEDPGKRYQRIMESTRNLKKTNQALGAATLVELSSGTPITLLSLANRVVGPRIRPFNMTVTNIPGPQFPMYLLESQMLANYPIVPLWAQHGLGMALFSYDGRLLWGIHADYDTLPDTPRFLEAVHASFKELQDLAG